MKGIVTKKSENTEIVRSAGAMGIATFLSRIMGLVREQVFAHFFGAGHAVEAYNIAFRIPNLLRDLFAEGAMSAALVPTFMRVRIEQGEERAWRVAGKIFRVLFAFVTIISVFGVIFSEKLVSWYAPSYRLIPGKFELTVLLTRILFPFFPLVALAAAFMAVLNSRGKFFVPAFASALFNLSSVLSGVFGYYLCLWLKIEPIIGMAVGVVIGGAVQAFSQWPSLKAVGYHFGSRPSGEVSWYRDPDLKKMLKLMGPGVVSQSATQVSYLVNSILATSQAPGAVAWLSYAFRLMQFPIGIFGVSFASAVAPNVSAKWVRGEVTGAVSAVDLSLKQVFAINLPAAVGLAVLSKPIIALLFEHGKFTSRDTEATAQVLCAYCVGLVFYSVVKVLLPVCYVVGRTTAAVQASLISMVSTVVFNLMLVNQFGQVGLALGTSCAAALNSFFLVKTMRNEFAKKGVVWSQFSLFFGFIRALFFALLMGVAVTLVSLGFEGVKEVFLVHGVSLFFYRLLNVGASVGGGLGLLLVMAYFDKKGPLGEAVHFFTGKLKNKLRPRKV